MELTSELSRVIANIKSIQDKLVRVCMLVNDDSIFRNEIKNFIKARDQDKPECVWEISNIPIHYTQEFMPHKDFPVDDFDIAFVFAGETVEKIFISSIRDAIKSLQSS